MSFLDKAKERAKDLATQAKDKVDDLKETRKVDELLSELGRITYRQHTGRSSGADVTEAEGLVSRLREMEHAGAEVIPSSQAPGSGATAPAAEHPAWEPPTATPPMPTADPDPTATPLP